MGYLDFIGVDSPLAIDATVVVGSVLRTQELHLVEIQGREAIEGTTIGRRVGPVGKHHATVDGERIAFCAIDARIIVVRARRRCYNAAAALKGEVALVGIDAVVTCNIKVTPSGYREVFIGIDA